MLRQTLRRHDAGADGAPAAITASLSRMRPRMLRIDYHASGGAGHIALPLREQEAGARTDGLWQRTCFELFVRPGDGPGYYEFNFSPSAAWAAYRFDGYRAGMAALEPLAAPQIDLMLRPPFDSTKPQPIRSRAEAKRDAREHLWVQVTLDLERLHALPVDVSWHVGLSGVIEEKSGAKSHWALAHPEGAPDFHDPACFALQLPAARPA